MKNKVYANASIVTGLSIAERSLGFLYRIVLSRLIGAEGLGLYQVALSLFSLFLTIGSGGIPITVSRMITKSKAENDPKGGSGAVGAGVTASLLLTLPVCVFFWAFGGKMTFLFPDARSFEVFRILLLGLTCTCIYAVVRGYFWGNKQFLAPSVMELAEETVMVIAGVLLLQNVASPAYGAKMAAWAVVISYLFSFAASTLWFFIKGGKLSSPKKQLKPLFVSSLPITSVRASGSLVNSAIAVLLPVMLVRAGFERAEALQLFGVVSGMVLPILFVPSTLIGSLALVLVPELSEDFYRKNYKRLYVNLGRGLKFAFLVACAIIPFFFALGEDFGALAYSNPTAGEMIKHSCLLLLPMSVTMISTAMLNSLGFEKQTFAFYFVGAAAMFLGVLFLPKYCGGYAYIIALGASYVLTALCNLIFLFKKCPIYGKRGGQVFVHQYLPTLLGTIFLCLSASVLNVFFKHFTGAILSIVFTAAVLFMESFLLYLVTGAISLRKLSEFFKSTKAPFRKQHKRKKVPAMKKTPMLAPYARKN